MPDCDCRGIGTSLHRADCPVALRLAEPFSWNKLAPKWNEDETCAQRAHLCLLYLNIHELITDGERSKAITRLKKVMAKEAEHAR